MESTNKKEIKIICTIGPASENKETLKGLIDAGMSIARCNFSHGTHEEHGRKFALVRELNKEYGYNVKIALDTKGPDIRLGDFENGSIMVKEGDLFSLFCEDHVGNQKGISVTYRNLYQDLKAGDPVSFCSGLVLGKVKEIKGKEIVVEIEVGGKLANHKCVNFPGVDVKLPFLSPADIEDLKYGVEQKVDLIMASFLNKVEDLRELRKIIGNIPVIAKIESAEGVKNMEAIIKEADGVMVARGGLGDNNPLEVLPTIQKEMVKIANRENKFVIVATEMMLNMCEKPRPSRAEVSDVYNAVMDGADAVMTSEETAMGNYPVETIKYMRKITNEAWRNKYGK